MLIYDRFPTLAKAKQFAVNCKQRLLRRAVVCRSQEESNKIDPFPFQLDAPIVLVSRLDDLSGERAVDALAAHFGGTFAGT